MGNWPESWIKYWVSRGDIANLKATIVFPSQDNQEFQQGQKIKWSINYEGTVYFIFPVFWNEEGYLDTKEPGTKLLFSQNGAGGDLVRWYSVKQGKRLGTQYNNYDDIIIAKGNQYGVPADLLKSLIHQEAIKDTQQRIFVTQSYRYEAHIDYDYYSGPNAGDRIFAHPNHHFTIQGKDTRGRTIPKGNQLPSNYLAIARDYSFLSLNTTDTNGDGNLTAAELVANNPRQGWYDKPNWNFTAQLVLASSYGLGQIMYETALNRGFDTQTSNPARDVYDLFKPDVSIDLAAGYLRNCYDTNQQNWKNALICYNGKESYANDVIDRWQSGIYQPIN